MHALVEKIVEEKNKNKIFILEYKNISSSGLFFNARSNLQCIGVSSLSLFVENKDT